MSLFAALFAGGLVGVRHAFEADHLAAIATLVEDDAPTRPGVVGASWGIGHSLPVALIGLTFFLLGIRLPESVTVLFEALVGAILVFLGVRLVLDVVGPVELRRHAHDSLHHHLDLGRFSLGSTHAHIHGGSFAVGAIHGIAGSGVLVVLLVAASPTFEAALAFLAAFSLLSVVTMGTVSFAWDRALGTGVTRVLRIGAGVGGALIGLSLIAAQFSVGLL